MIPFPNKKYNIIYADPPWTYKTYSDRNMCPYPVMKNKDIYDLPIEDIIADNSILFLWVTFPKLLEGIETINKWGFVYKSCAFVWVKTNKKYNTKQYAFLPEDSFSTFWGMGHWTRANSECCLLATKGNPKRVSKGVHQIVYDPIKEHSKKPAEVRDRIVKLCGDLPRIELFARQKVEGWDCWGNEV